MPELVIPIPENIGPGFIDWEEFDYVEGFTVDSVRMQLEFAGYQGVQVDSILLQFGICYGGSVRHAIEIYNYLRALNIPIRAHVLSLTASSGTIVACAADTVEMEHTAQWMVHRPLYAYGTYSQRGEELRADADRIDREEQNMVDIYAAATGKSEEEIRQLVSVDRFLSATEAATFGFVTTVKPLRAKVPTKTEATAKLKHFKLAVARADRRVVTARKKPVPVAATPKPSITPKPMANKAAAPKAGAKKAAPTAAQKANLKIVADLAKQLGVKASFETETETEEVVEAVVETTETDQDGALLYHDNALAQGSAVFYDEGLTEAAEDGTYGLADGRSIVVAGGVVESITEAEAIGETTAIAPAANSNADILARLQKMEQEREADRETITGLNAQLEKFNKTVPPRPNASSRPRPQVDVKNSGKPKPKAEHHQQL